MEVVFGALITGGFGLVGVLVNRSAKRVSAINTQEQLLNKEMLERIEGKIDDQGTALVEHLTWHVRNPPARRKVSAA